MSELSKRGYSVVVAVDFSEISHLVIERAFDHAVRHHAKQIHLISCLDTGSTFRKSSDHSGELEEIGRHLHKLVSEKLEDFPKPEDDRQVHIHARAGRPADLIANLAAETFADVVVLGVHGWNLSKRSRSGSLPEKLMRIAQCSLLVVQPVDYGEAAAAPQCEDCVALRASSDGDDWFCEAHASSSVAHLIGGSLTARLRQGSYYGS